jgi:hypothetical protein
LEFASVTFHKGTSYNVADAEMTFFLGPSIFRIPDVLVSVVVTILCLNVLPLYTSNGFINYIFKSRGTKSGDLGGCEVVISVPIQQHETCNLEQTRVAERGQFTILLENFNFLFFLLWKDKAFKYI